MPFTLYRQDSMKEAILETNPYLMAMTVAVSLLHSVFEFLAFKNGQLLTTAPVRLTALSS